MKIAKIFLAALVLFAALGLEARAEQPLVQEGKTSVFQRVVSHPEAVLYADADATREAGHPRTFTSYYVYERKGDMMRVGVSTTKSDGWLKISQVTECPQAITMVFTDQMGREPVLFFRDKNALVELCNSEGIGNTVKQYATLFANPDAPKPADLPVIASEPMGEAGQVARDSFYLLPVLNIDRQFEDGGTQLLEVASIDPGVAKAKGDDGAQGAAKAADEPMKTGIVFLIDTTISMGPYIEQTRKVINTIFNSLEKSPAKDNVAVAVVAFRSNVDKRPKTEYNTRIISDFVTVNDRAKLDKLLNDLQESSAPTHAYDEDSLSGVKEAVDALSWDKVNSKAMLLITDAGPLGADDPTGATGMSPEAMADYLRAKNIYLTVAHVLGPTPAAKKDRPYAEKSYRALSRLSNGRSSYIPINAPDAATGAAEFDKVANTMAQTYCTLAERQMQGKMLAKPSTKDLPKTASAEEQAKHTAEAIGYAMQLQFAGDKNKTRAPEVVKAWIADADLPSLESDPDAAPVPVAYPAVLLTKTQLSQLRDQIKSIIKVADEAFLQDSENFNFYEQLISAAAQASRDPSQFSNDPGANLAQKGVLLEVLGDLPYKSQILRLKQEDWSNMSTGEQREFIKRLKGLVRNYDAYDSDNQRWEGFGSKNANEWVYRVPLNMLP